MKGSAQIFLAILVSCGFFGCIFYMLGWGFPPENKDALNSLMGVLTTIFTLQQNYFFGSSSGSRSKDDTLNEIANKVAPPQPVNIPNAETVTVATESGNINVNPEGKPQ